MMDLIKKHKHLIAYLFFGVMTTVVNIASFYIFSHFVFRGDANLELNNTLAWVLAVTFAYLSNRKFVFESKASSRQEILIECAKFYGSRVVTLLVDLGLMALMVKSWHWDEMLAKVISNVVVIVLNYALSKLVVFRKK